MSSVVEEEALTAAPKDFLMLLFDLLIICRKKVAIDYSFICCNTKMKDNFTITVFCSSKVQNIYTEV